MDGFGSVWGGIQGRTTGAVWLVGLDIMPGVEGTAADGTANPPACKHKICLSCSITKLENEFSTNQPTNWALVCSSSSSIFFCWSSSSCFCLAKS